MCLRQFALVYFLSTGLGTLTWWIAMFSVPDWRMFFRLANAPDQTLLAFAVPDLLLFVGSALMCAFGLNRKTKWFVTALIVHTAIGAYAALFSVMLTMLSGGEAWAGAAFMAPSLVVPPLLLWAAQRGKLP